MRYFTALVIQVLSSPLGGIVRHRGTFRERRFSFRFASRAINRFQETLAGAPLSHNVTQLSSTLTGHDHALVIDGIRYFTINTFILSAWFLLFIHLRSIISCSLISISDIVFIHKNSRIWIYFLGFWLLPDTRCRFLGKNARHSRRREDLDVPFRNITHIHRFSRADRYWRYLDYTHI